MGSTLTQRAARYLADAGRAFERAPVEVATLLVLAAAWSWAVRSGGAAFQSWAELAAAAVVVLAAAWTGTLLHALGAWSARTRMAVTLAGAVAAALYGTFVADFQRGAEVWRGAMLLLAAVLWLVAMPWLHGRSVDTMRTVTGRVVLRIIGALLYSGALYVGLALALGAVNTLFELDLDGSIYAHVFGWVFLALAPWIVAGGIDDYVVPADAREWAVAGVAQRMAAFLVPPLLVIYAAILYAYVIRIGVTGEVPKNLVSPMVLAAGGLAMLALLLFDPQPARGPADRALRWAPPLFLPLAVLGAAAIIMRVDQYGWTEFRLLRLALLVAMALLSALAIPRLMRRRRFPLHAMLLALAATLIATATGPWSAMAVSRRSQQARLDSALRTAGIDPATALVDVAERRVPATLHDQVENLTMYLAQNHGRRSLPPAVRAALPDPDISYGVAHRLGLRADVPTDTVRQVRFGRLGDAALLEVEGYRVRRITIAPGRGPAARTDVPGTVTDGVLRFDVAGERYAVSLAGLVAALAPARSPDTGALSGEARLDVTGADGAAAGHLIVLDVTLETARDVIVVQRLDGLLLLRR